jgi:GPH family glycoside/pentoside/hexuronide:cation symporter
MSTVTEPTTTAAGGKPYTAPNAQIYAWAIGGIASHGMICMFGQAMNIFTVGFGLSAVVVGWAMMLPRVIDAILDPIIGHMSDDTHTRWGRRKPYLVLGSVLGSMAIMGIWWASPGWSSTAQLAFLLVVGTLAYICYGVYTMSWSALGYELTDDYHERSRVMAISGMFASIVFFLNGWVYWVALRQIFKTGIAETIRSLWNAGWDWAGITLILSQSFQPAEGASGSEIYGVRWISVVVALAVITTALIATVVCKERFTHANREHVPIIPAIRTTMKNRPFLIFLLYKIFQVFGERVFMGLLFYIGIYYVCKGDKSMATSMTGIGATVGTILGFVLVPFMKPISQKIGKKNGLVLAAAVTFVVALIQPWVLTPEHPYLLLVPILVPLPLLMISLTLSNAIVPDICDTDELETGQRREGLFTAVMGFIQKLEISLTVLIVGYMVSFSGFDSKLATQPDAVMSKMLWLAIIPNIIFTFLTLLTAARFPMTEASMAEVRRQLDERRLAAAAAGEPTDEIAEEYVHEHPEIAGEAAQPKPDSETRPR